MKRGFTILELLVASLLLGMLTTILTMIINQSAIAWRTGSAMVSDLDDVRDRIGLMREEADNAFAWDGQLRRIVGLWDEDGRLLDRACDAPGSSAASEPGNQLKQLLSSSGLASKSATTPVWSYGQNVQNVGMGGSGNSKKTYTVNVMSAGPDRQFDTWDDIWSFPDDFE